MESWITRNEPGKQLLLSSVCAATGLLLSVGFRDFISIGSNEGAGFLLGLLLLLMGVAGFLASGEQTVTVDPDAKRITIQDSNRFGTKIREIRFGDIVDVSIGYLGRKSNLATWYYLVLKLRSGEAYSLFSPGRFYRGGSDRSAVEGWRERLEKYLVQ